ncbi:OLC1v1013373C1 [Oldenlandia corymbosa var. corymbosa]|uniref:Non-specific lipid-transfer protein n=1 Tax=Oldenlandia corymbosa var. corymbosa TaxID=529605 RepID=A0AAV1E1S5_OLDCO|nr:OLC1v1013373C1 [Oldenlandia corymbosa var. corymbosa]
MASQKIATLVLVLGLLIMPFSIASYAQIPCNTVYNDLYPCLGFVMGGGKVDPACCSGFKTVLGLAKTKTDRQGVCSCLKSLVSDATDGEIKNAAQIPKLCGLNIPYVISRNIDCSK